MSDLLKKEELAGLSVDDLIELSVDQIAEVTPFVPKPTGSYRFEVKSCDVEEVGDGNAIVVVYHINEVIELLHEDQAELVGEIPCDYKESYFIGGDSDFGLKTFRTIFDGLVGEGEEVKIRELMERAVGVTGEGLLKHRKWVDKNTKELKEGNSWESTAITFD